MASLAVSHIPAMAGKAVFSFVFTLVKKLVVKIVNYPLISAISIIMGFGILIGANNALFLQKQAHPSPFFAKSHAVETQAVLVNSPVPIAAPKVIMQRQVSPVFTPVIVAPNPAVSEAVQKIGHDQIILLQQKLAKLGYFAGKADGFYGPNTANAIRAFEEKNAMKVVGAITPKVYQIIINAQNKPVSQLIVNSSNLAGVQPSVIVTPVVLEPINNITNASLSEDPLMEIVRNAALIRQPTAALTNETVATRIVVDKEMIKKVQTGLASLGFLYGTIDGVAGQTTAKAIRKFEVFHNYKVSGEVTPELLDMLKAEGASI